MDSAEWENARREQNDLIRAQLALLRSVPRASRKRFRCLEWVCAKCGDVLLEVFGTSPYPVILTREITKHPAAPELVTEIDGRRVTGADIYRQMESQGPRFLRGEWMFTPFDPVAPASGSLVSACRCRRFRSSMRAVAEDLANKQARRVIPVAQRDHGAS